MDDRVRGWEGSSKANSVIRRRCNIQIYRKADIILLSSLQKREKNQYTYHSHSQNTKNTKNTKNTQNSVPASKTEKRKNGKHINESAQLNLLKTTKPKPKASKQKLKRSSIERTPHHHTPRGTYALSLYKTVCPVKIKLVNCFCEGKT